jgi:hypothetical protein
MKYEMSIQIEPLFEHLYNAMENTTLAVSNGIGKTIVSKQNFDQVDYTIDSVEAKAESIISDQAYQRDKQRHH